jgi:hypothetical protein
MSPFRKVQSIKNCSDGVLGAVTPYGLAGGYRRFGGTCFLYLQGWSGDGSSMFLRKVGIRLQNYTASKTRKA